MKSLYFWKEWHRPYKNLYWTFLVLAILVFIYGIYNYWVGAGHVIHWELVNLLEPLKTVVETVSAGNFKFNIPLDNFIVFQYFEGSNLTIGPGNGYLFLLIVILSVNLIMALLTTMPKIWFYAGMGGFIGFMVMMNIDQIMLFGQPDKTALIIVLVLYLSPAYFFREINDNIDLHVRFIIFCIVSILIGILFYLYSGVEDPFLYIANYGILAPVILTVLFIVSIAHEIIFAFLYLVTGSNTESSKNSLQHFIFISLIFLVYVGITYMHYTSQITWDLIFLNPFLLAGITFILGIWGYRRREELFKEIFSFYPVGALFYLAFGIIAIMTLSYIFNNANDPLIETFEDVILYSQIGFGTLFFIYVVTNFGPLLLENLKVVKVVYQSRVFPFYIFRIGGLLIVGYIFYRANFLPYFQSMAGYYNYIGDIFMIEGQLGLAEEYYTEASAYEFQNHRSNYAMATLARMKGDKYDEAYYFSNALLKQPTEFSYINLSNIYLRNDQYFDGLFQLKEALNAFPGSYPILNNMGYYYSRTDISDSSFYYFDLSRNIGRNKEVPSSNIYGLLAKAHIDISIDSLRNVYKIRNNLAGRANQLALQTQFNKMGDAVILPDIKANFRKDYFAYVYNTGLNVLHSDNTEFFKDLLAYADTSGIDQYKIQITVLTALNSYFNHKVTEAFRLLYSLGEGTTFNDTFFNILGILALDAGRPRLAIDYFSRTSTEVNEQYKLNLGIANIEAGLLEPAGKIFRSLSQSQDGSVRALSSEYLEIMDWTPPGDIDTLDNEWKYLLFHIRFKQGDPLMAEKLLASIDNRNIRTLAEIERIEYLLENGRNKDAKIRFDKLDLYSIPQGLIKRVHRLEYILAINEPLANYGLSGTGRLKTNDPMYLYDQLLKVINIKDLQDTVELDSTYQILASWDPFFEEGVMASVEYFRNIRNRDNYAYNLLVNALSVNMYSKSLNKYYIKYCLDDGLIDFATNRLTFMRQNMKDEGLEEYYAIIRQEIARKDAEMSAW
jgi:hypothetical protein